MFILIKQSKNNYYINIIMNFIKKEITIAKNKISCILNQSNNDKLPFTNYDLSNPIDTTLYSIKIEK
jgi:hypothetical protein